MIHVGIVGATGYTGVELLRLLSDHPGVSVKIITSRGYSNLSIGEMFQSLRGKANLELQDPINAHLNTCDIVFFATPPGIAMHDAPPLLKEGVKVIDLSGDYRIKDVATWQNYYGMVHASPKWLETAVYGLPEMNRSAIKQATLLSNPGCYPTAVQLGFLPLLESELIDPCSLVANVTSGLSGAGRKAGFHTLFSENSENFRAYSMFGSGHRHLPEISENLSIIANKPTKLTFVPHLAPMIRGIHATLYARIIKEVNFQKIFEDRYKEEPFIDVLPAGQLPETRYVRTSNMCRIAVCRPQGQNMLVIFSVIDNLIKGAAGQAVQNMNLMFGLKEATAIKQLAVFP